MKTTKLYCKICNKETKHIIESTYSNRILCPYCGTITLNEVVTKSVTKCNNE